jgi:hypothetical protein
VIDAWEVANRNNLFAPVSLKRLPFLGNSDFHKPKHIYSWKTLLHCEKETETIKECIRLNQRVSITLYRETQPESCLEKNENAELYSLATLARSTLPAFVAEPPRQGVSHDLQAQVLL